MRRPRFVHDELLARAEAYVEPHRWRRRRRWGPRPPDREQPAGLRAPPRHPTATAARCGMTIGCAPPSLIPLVGKVLNLDPASPAAWSGRADPSRDSDRGSDGSPRALPAEAASPLGLVRAALRQHVGDGLAWKCSSACQHLVQHAAERPDVRALVDRLAARLLRTHVGGGAQNARPCLRHRRTGDRRRLRCIARRAARRFERFREAEVEHLHRAVRPHLDVGRLQIAMDDALLVRRFERFGDLLRDRQRLVERDRPARDAVRQSSPSTSSMTSARDAARSSRARGSARCSDDSARRASSASRSNRASRSGSCGERFGQDLDRDVALELRVRAR